MPRRLGRGLLARAGRLARDATAQRFVLLTGSNLAGSGLGFLLVLLIIHAAGEAALGEFSFGLTVISYAMVVATLGTEYSAITLAASPAARLGTLAPSVVLVRLLTAIPLYVAIVGLAIGLPALAPYREVLIILGLALPLNACNLIWLPQASHRIPLVAACTLAAPLLTLAFCAAAALGGQGLTAFSIGKVAADLLVVGLLIVATMPQIGRLDWRAGWHEVRQLARLSAPTGGANMLRGLALSSDIIVLGYLVSTAELGRYSAAFRLFTLMLSVGTMYHLLIVPRFAEQARDPKRFAQEVAVALRHIWLIGLPVTGLVCALAPLVMTKGFGPSFAEATPSLQLLTAAAFANVVNRPYRQVLLTLGRQQTDLRLTGISCAVHLVLKVTLGLAFGISGVALGTLVGEVVLTLLSRRAALRLLEHPSVDTTGR